MLEPGSWRRGAGTAERDGKGRCGGTAKIENGAGGAAAVDASDGDAAASGGAGTADAGKRVLDLRGEIVVYNTNSSAL